MYMLAKHFNHENEHWVDCLRWRKRPGYLGLVTNKAWLPWISHRFLLANLFFFLLLFVSQDSIFAVAFHFAGWLLLCLSAIGGSTFLSIESKNFEFSIKEGGLFSCYGLLRGVQCPWHVPIIFWTSSWPTTGQYCDTGGEDRIVVAAKQNNHGGGHNKPSGSIKGKEKVLVFHNLNTHASSYPHCDQCDLYSEKAKAKIGAEFVSNINGKI